MYIVINIVMAQYCQFSQLISNLSLSLNFCKFRFYMVGAQVSTYNFVAENDAVAMQVALQKYGPLTVAISVVNSLISYA